MIHPEDLRDLVDYYRELHGIFNECTTNHPSVHFKQSQLNILTLSLIRILAHELDHNDINRSKNLLVELMFQDFNFQVNGTYNLINNC